MTTLSELVAARYLLERQASSEWKPGQKVKVKGTHGVKDWHGDTGEIDKYVPFGKYYVDLAKHGRQMIDQNDLEPVK